MSGQSATPGDRLDALRAAPRRRRLATVGAAVVGLVVVPFHWLGFVLGGALVALTQPSLGRGLLAGLGFGVLSWLVFALWISGTGNLGLYLGMGQVLAVSTAIPLVGSLLGALARGVR
ncbi:hypothetical protein [Halorientalis pallida]|uniref:Uncharacterized protein n=1 Tax=Halorientalis pallida TaxID=2479928 RepID=A0A498KXG8_9EURY|nr:hypothetical protein [Halorientalis pallida]RXK50331.1 hypothetical protein EAF64_07145 [Halorientalis pallida]